MYGVALLCYYVVTSSFGGQLKFPAEVKKVNQLIGK